MEAPRHPNEKARLAVLQQCQILDTAPEEVFESITQLAAYICRTPIALVSLVDEARQWFKAHVGLEIRETPRRMSFCAHAILQGDLFIIPDATKDPLFSDNPLVTGPPHIRFYAGAPLIPPEGHPLGTLCVIDIVPRELDESQRHALKALSRQVLAQIETRRAFAELATTLGELKKTEQALHTSQEIFSKAFRSGPDPMTISAVESGRYVDVNDAFERLTGYSAEEAIGRTAAELGFWPSAEARQHFIHDLKLQPPVQDFEVKLRVRSGEIRDALVSADIMEINGDPHVLAIIRDITERKKHLTAIKESEERYRHLFQRNLAGVYRTTLDGQVLDCNESFARILGFDSPQAVMQHRATEFYSDQQDRNAFIRHLLRQRSLTNYETRLRRKDGNYASILENVSLIGEGASAVIEGTAIDITDYKQLETQFRQAQKMEGIGRLAGGVAHDFNNLLCVIAGYSHLIAEATQPGDPIRAHADNVLNASERAATLIRQLLAFSRKQVLCPRVVDLNSIVSEIAKMLPHLIGEDVKIRVLRGPELRNVKVDPAQVEQILMNLAVNARDAMPRGGTLTIETRNVTFDAEYAQSHSSVSPGDFVMLAVADTGTGMTDETRSHLFEPFFTTKEPGKGTGLGLSTIYGIVKQSGGNIWVYSELGKGTTFRIYFPQVDEPVSAQTRAGSFTSSAGGAETILLVEDETALRKLARHFLDSKGYTVLEGANADEAIEIARQHLGEIQLLVTDITMPGMNGRELATRLIKHKNSLKVILTSGYTDASAHQNVVSDRQMPLLQKPFSLEELASTVRAVLDSKP